MPRAYRASNPTTVAAEGVRGLWEVPGRGAKRKWQETDLQTVEQWIEQSARTYNSHQLAQKLAEQAAGQIESKAIAAPAAKKGWRWKRTRQRSIYTGAF